jgi:hypothetical protein
MRRELALPRAFVALKSSVMWLAARPRHIDSHYRTFLRRLRTFGAPIISTAWREASVQRAMP